MNRFKNSHTHEKSNVTIFLDVIRNLLILLITGYAVYRIWNWNWIVGLISAIPIYILVMNLVGFATLPLYTLTPESKLIRKGFKNIEDGNVSELEKINEEFENKFNAKKTNENN